MTQFKINVVIMIKNVKKSKKKMKIQFNKLKIFVFS